MKLQSLTAIVFGCLGLAACSSGSSGVPEPASFDEMADQGRALAARYEDPDLTPVGSMPTSGSATYNGVAAYSSIPDIDDILENAETMSTVTLQANFASDSVSGQLSNFRDYENNALAGSVSLNNGSIAGNSISADLSGNVDSIPVAGALQAGFVGPDAEAVVGTIEADYGGKPIYGIFGAER